MFSMFLDVYKIIIYIRKILVWISSGGSTDTKNRGNSTRIQLSDPRIIRILKHNGENQNIEQIGIYYVIDQKFISLGMP